MIEKHILNTTYEKDNFGAEYSLISGVSKVSVLFASRSIIIKDDAKSSLNMELSFSEISSISVLQDYKKDYRIRLNFLAILSSILLCLLIEGSLKIFPDPLFAIDIFFGITMGVLISSLFPIKSKLVTISFGDNGKSKIQLSFSGTIGEMQLIKKMNDSLSK